MTTLTMDTLSIATADPGPVNPLPPIQGDASLDKHADLAEAGETIRRQAGYGRVATVLPYLMQDGYSRIRTVREHPAVILENEYLRATVLPALGGRLWSLRDLVTGRELLYTNTIIQPANLALRNAWVAGGVEWNIGTIGHSPLTCAPMHAVRVTADDGTPVLRLYEFERIRRVVYQVDLHLPAGSRVLYAYVRITNPNPTDVPMYWWSNTAIPQTADTRVLAPATRSWHYSYDRVLRHDPVAPRQSPGGPTPVDDISYPARFSDAADFFFDLPAGAPPWIAAVNADGTGLFQTSTSALVGRKLFRWGTSRGGRRWQQWLSGPIDDPAGGYAEIQAGLAATQFEHVPMPASATWSWTEAYGPLDLDAGDAHGPWDAATRAAALGIRSLVGPDDLGLAHRSADKMACRAPDMPLHPGSDWGALDRRLRRETGEQQWDLPGTPFGENTLTAEQRPWLALLDTGRYPDPQSGTYPDSAHDHPVLRRALAASAGWAAPALLGVAYATEGDWDSARDAWSESLRRADNAYARRNLAVAALRAGDHPAANANYRAALQLSDHRALVVEAARAFIEGGEADEAERVIDRLDPALRRVGRVRVLEATAALATGDLTRCGEILSDPGLEVADLKEGEDSLDALWWQYRAAVVAAERGAVPTDERAAELADGRAATESRGEAHQGSELPAHLDFRMKPDSSRQ